jgi:hypothetical protein
MSAGQAVPSQALAPPDGGHLDFNMARTHSLPAIAGSSAANIQAVDNASLRPPAAKVRCGAVCVSLGPWTTRLSEAVDSRCLWGRRPQRCALAAQRDARV